VFGRNGIQKLCFGSDRAEEEGIEIINSQSVCVCALFVLSLLRKVGIVTEVETDYA